MTLFDSHCHLDFPLFETDFSHILQSAQHVGVKRFLIPSVGPENWSRVAELSSQHPEIYYALGLHPYFLKADYTLYQTQLMARLDARPTRCVAIGECGLDFAIKVDPALQEEALQWQFELARQYGLPVILHCRKAHNRLIQMVKVANLPKGGVLHAFSGSYEQGMEWVRLGFSLGIGGTITYPRANKTRQAVAKLPLEHLLLETDAPDMPLNGYQGVVNTPSQIVNILTILCELRNQTKQTVASQLWKNSNSLFSICE